MFRRFLFISVVLTIITHSQVWALEIRNLRIGQEGKRAYVQYDLAGKPGEKNADVLVSIEVGGERYSFEKLALHGDFGKNVTVGVGKRIWWDLLNDMPAGYEGEVVWTLDTTPTAEHLTQIKRQKELEEKTKNAPLQLTPTNSPALQASIPKPPEAAVTARANLWDDSLLLKASNHAVIDNKNGLMWAKLGDDTTEKFTYDRAKSYIAKMNINKFGGFNDWRLPGDLEVAKLFAVTSTISSKTGKPAIKVLLQHFPNLEDWHYWQDGPTSRPLGRGNNYRRSFDIEDGSATADLYNDNLCILPVRDAAVPTPAPGQEQQP